ncbi:hypothetical protein FJT64_020072 [Amphibalanus amphitrite]|uniref:Apple domain-containing protein n=1 Tax=Amphibalanus amphitrite TaxID=1232801 RepID=A0A6A4WPH5_AMPAM|nr:hypothetical protein FJT64_020072 [Amphibalanus amphitrite]
MAAPGCRGWLALLALALARTGRCAVESHSAAGLHRSGLLPLTPLQTVPAGPTLARRAHCLARCVRRDDCVSFNYGQLPDGTAGCQLLGRALCQAGGGFNELQRDAGVSYFDVYRDQNVGAQETAVMAAPGCRGWLALLALALARTGRCAVESHSAAGLHRSGLLPLTPLQTVPAGPTLARRAHCLARCVRRDDCVSFNYGQLPDGTAGCQLLGRALCEAGGGFNELQRDAGVNYFDVYRDQNVGAQEVRKPL